MYADNLNKNMTLIHTMPSKLSFFYDVIFKSHVG